jgi:ATP-dependent DNA helicase RecG
MPAAAAVLIQKSDAVAEAVLADLASAGLIEAQSAGEERSYHLSATTYRRLDRRIPVMRRRKAESAQAEQMIIQHVRDHGRITRQETAELCGISVYQATRLLRKLVSEGTFDALGVGRGSWYELRAQTRART